MKVLSVWLFRSQLILFWFRLRMDECSYILLIERMIVNGWFRTGMDNGSIILVIRPINYIGVA